MLIFVIDIFVTFCEYFCGNQFQLMTFEASSYEYFFIVLRVNLL